MNIRHSSIKPRALGRHAVNFRLVTPVEGSVTRVKQTLAQKNEARRKRHAAHAKALDLLRQQRRADFLFRKTESLKRRPPNDAWEHINFVTLDPATGRNRSRTQPKWDKPAPVNKYAGLPSAFEKNARYPLSELRLAIQEKRKPRPHTKAAHW